jgi:hypothetical protein
MQAVILAGGLGTRLGPLTRKIPKPMVPVAGVPYLEHQLRLLARQSFRDVLLLTGYLGEQIESYFGNGSRLGLRLRYAREPSRWAPAARCAMPAATWRKLPAAVRRFAAAHPVRRRRPALGGLRRPRCRSWSIATRPEKPPCIRMWPRPQRPGDPL